MSPITSLDLTEYASLEIQTNLALAMDEYCQELKDEGRISSCDELSDDPPFPNPRRWTSWSNDNLNGNSGYTKECPENQFLSGIQTFIIHLTL